MLFACWKVHIVKNCGWGLEHFHFSSQRSQFVTIWADAKLVNNIFFFFLLSLSNHLCNPLKEKKMANGTLTYSFKHTKILTLIKT